MKSSSLRDRGRDEYPLLIGRRTIQHLGLIDVTRQFTVEPEVPGVKGPIFYQSSSLRSTVDVIPMMPERRSEMPSTTINAAC